LNATQNSCQHIIKCHPTGEQRNSADKLHHPRSVAYSVEHVLLNKHQISSGRACLHCYCEQLCK